MTTPIAEITHKANAIIAGRIDQNHKYLVKSGDCWVGCSSKPQRETDIIKILYHRDEFINDADYILALRITIAETLAKGWGQ